MLNTNALGSRKFHSGEIKTKSAMKQAWCCVSLCDFSVQQTTTEIMHGKRIGDESFTLHFGAVYQIKVNASHG